MGIALPASMGMELRQACSCCTACVLLEQVLQYSMGPV